MKKNFLFTFLLSGFFMFVFSANASAQLGVTPEQKTSLTIACEICTMKNANKPLSEVQKASMARLDAAGVRWCPTACDLLAKVNKPNATVSLTKKEREAVRAIHAALNPANLNNVQPTPNPDSRSGAN